MKSKGALAFFVLAVFPPAILTACGNLFGKADADAGADAAVAVVFVDAEAAPAPSAEESAAVAPLGSAAPAPAKVVVVTKDGGTKIVDAGSVPDGATVVVVDAGKIPVPVPPASWKLPSGLPSSLGSLKIPSGWPKLPTK